MPTKWALEGVTLQRKTTRGTMVWYNGPEKNWAAKTLSLESQGKRKSSNGRLRGRVKGREGEIQWTVGSANTRTTFPRKKTRRSKGEVVAPWGEDGVEIGGNLCSGYLLPGQHRGRKTLGTMNNRSGKGVRVGGHGVRNHERRYVSNDWRDYGDIVASNRRRTIPLSTGKERKF